MKTLGFSLPPKLLRGIGLPLALLLAGCAAPRIKQYQVEVRVPAFRQQAARARVGLVLAAADALREPNLSRTEEYVLREKTALTTVLIRAAAERMRAAGIEPLEASEEARASGGLILTLQRLETQLQDQRWFASALVRAERTGRDGKPLGRWESVGRGAYNDSRVRAGGAGLALGAAIGDALDRLPWSAIASGRPAAR